MAAPGNPSADDISERLGEVRASIRPDVEISRHLFGGESTYVLNDPVTGQTHRFAAADYQILTGIDQHLMLKEAFESLVKREVLEADQRNEFFQFVVHLQTLGLLSLPIADGKSLHERMQKRMDAQRKGKAMKWMFLRIPLCQPDAWLSRIMPFFGPLFSPMVFWLWVIALAVCGYILFKHRQEFSSPLGTMLATSNVPVLWTLLIGLKAFHELGHAVACKHFGGRVPELGLYMMMGTPCAYVDASSSWSFPSRWHRIVVALAGMYFESMLAIAAIFVWLFTDAGVIHSAAHYAVVLSTVVTIGFNANPLMKYDGYFVLTDLLRMPNLQRDAQKASHAVLKKVLYGVALPEGPWSVGRYALAAFGFKCMLYRVAVVTGIATLLLMMIPVAGPVFAAMFILPTVIGLLRNVFLFVTRSKELADRRKTAIAVSLAVGAVIVVIVGFLPMPGGEKTLAVVRRFEEQSIRAMNDGFLVGKESRDGCDVSEGALLFRFENEDLVLRRDELQANVSSLTVALANQAATDQQLAALTKMQLTMAQQELVHIEGELERLRVTAPQEGRFIVNDKELHLGRFIRRGEPLATITQGPWVMRTLLTEEACADIMPEVGQQVLVMLQGRPGEVFEGRISHLQSMGSRRISDVVLTQVGGGDIAVDQEMQAQQNFFEIVVELERQDITYLRRGMTGIVQFDRHRQTIIQFLARRALRFLDQMREVS